MVIRRRQEGGAGGTVEYVVSLSKFLINCVRQSKNLILNHDVDLFVAKTLRNTFV